MQPFLASAANTARVRGGAPSQTRGRLAYRAPLADVAAEREQLENRTTGGLVTAPPKWRSADSERSMTLHTVFDFADHWCVLALSKWKQHAARALISAQMVSAALSVHISRAHWSLGEARCNGGGLP
ncbi:hypothetical protein SKAU_G00363360 [Synaphobranchus kaupii]|uniref:Uncharacterized protein n=1 Tax=Synaphobranchus kaupii TaxID=118154 RepID=A0A9Q1EIU0_SYNKA|nr:hypothetical protein SKAU_G00363360 [Synaphobranchus kaupii]